jgi:ribosomal subunit interface protein
MIVSVHYQSLESSPWLEQFISSRLEKLQKYLNQAASIQVHLKFENRRYITSLVIHHKHHDHAFTGNGDNLYESFAQAVDKAARTLGEEKRMLKDKINRQYYSLKHLAC